MPVRVSVQTTNSLPTSPYRLNQRTPYNTYHMCQLVCTTHKCATTIVCQSDCTTHKSPTTGVFNLSDSAGHINNCNDSRGPQTYDVHVHIIGKSGRSVNLTTNRYIMCRQRAGLAFVVIFSKQPAGHALKTPALQHSSNICQYVCTTHKPSTTLANICQYVCTTHKPSTTLANICQYVCTTHETHKTITISVRLPYNPQTNYHPRKFISVCLYKPQNTTTSSVSVRHSV
jgi:hypothetical protein